MVVAAAVPPGVNVTSHSRCGDADRQRASDRIGEAYARGFLDKSEAMARQEAVAACSMAAQLEQLVHDIPVMSRWNGASLAKREHSRAEGALKWYISREPWSGLVSLIGGLIAGIAPTAATNNSLVAALTIPPGIVVALFAFIAFFAWLVALTDI